MATLLTSSVKLDAATKARLQKLAELRQRSPNWLMRDAIEQYVIREEAREELRRDALAAWQNYEATGQHATAGETDDWLAALEAGEDAQPPECHG